MVQGDNRKQTPCTFTPSGLLHNPVVYRHFEASEHSHIHQRRIRLFVLHKQAFNLISSYTVYQNVALALQIDGVPEKEIKEKVPAIIEKVGLSKYRNRKVSKLSGGQRQRVAIARALAKDTKILVADEPTGNLDSESAQGIVELLTGIAQDKLVVVVTHNFDQFKDHATRVIKMYDGKIVEDTGAGSKKEKEKEAAAETIGEVSDTSEVTEKSLKKAKNNMPYGTQVRLGVRNTFNLPAKFLH